MGVDRINLWPMSNKPWPLSSRGNSIKTAVILSTLAVVLTGGILGGTTIRSAALEQQAVEQHSLDVKLTEQKAAETDTRQADYTAAATAAEDTQAAIDAQAAADALAAQQAADAAAAQAAADAAAQAAAQAVKQRAAASPSTGLKQCPAGSSGNSGDATGMTSCFPDICFLITLPDAAHPECVTPFKP
jgi:hypothetical protein